MKISLQLSSLCPTYTHSTILLPNQTAHPLHPNLNLPNHSNQTKTKNAREQAGSVSVLGDWDTYVEQVTDTVLPPLSDRFAQPPTLNRFATVLGEGLLAVFNVWGGVGSEAGGAATTTATTTSADSVNGEGGGFSSGGSGSGSENEAGQALGAAAMLAAYEAVVEAATYPPCFMVLKVRVWWLAFLSL